MTMFYSRLFKNSFMITNKLKNVKRITQKYYDDFIDNLNLNSLSCPSDGCGHHDFVRHGYYERTVKFKGYSIRLRILRIKCKYCGSTHAILLDCMVPYSQLSLDIQNTIIACNHIDDFKEYMDSCLDLDESNFYYVRNQFKKYWKQRLLSLSISLKDDLVEKCFHYFSRQFMQIHCMRNILF